MDMPMKKKRTAASQAAARGPLPELPGELLDQLVKGPMTPAELQDLMLAFNKAVTVASGLRSEIVLKPLAGVTDIVLNTRLERQADAS